jgi:hypothetical protein
MQGKLEHLKNLLRHQVPSGDLGIILERAADLLIEKTMKDRFAQPARPSRRAVTASAHPVKTSACEMTTSAQSTKKPEVHAITASAHPAKIPEVRAITAITVTAQGAKARSRARPLARSLRAHRP